VEPDEVASGPELAGDEHTGRPGAAPRSPLQERVQAGSSRFEFGALLGGVSTLDAYPAATNPRDGAELVWIPAGAFTMGSDMGERRERPAHRVIVDGFWIYKTPVTVGQYRRFYAELGRHLRSEPPWGWHEEHPMVNVIWEYASAYAQWAGAELPTEAEWEYAARGPEPREFPWGDEWDSARCRSSVGLKHASVAPIGAYPEGASPRGVLDMAGNVWEWTADWYEETYYEISPERNPVGPAFGTHKVVRGGSWGNGEPHDFRTSMRAVCAPDARGTSIGFRCAVRTSILGHPV
jgi:formylglycine-generating enzyme required for sulfatase activity